MIEGQLKKRIIENLIVLHKGTNLPVFMNLASATNAVVDEAKKDFPIKQSSFEIQVTRQLIAQTGDIQGVQWLKEKLEILEWFNEQFGASK